MTPSESRRDHHNSSSSIVPDCVRVYAYSRTTGSSNTPMHRRVYIVLNVIRAVRTVVPVLLLLLLVAVAIAFTHQHRQQQQQ